jgi:hypothetical protein
MRIRPVLRRKVPRKLARPLGRRSRPRCGSRNASVELPFTRFRCSAQVLSMRFMQRHQEKIRSAAVTGASSGSHAVAPATAVKDRPAAVGATAAPAKRCAPIPGRRSFGGFNPHIEVPTFTFKRSVKPRRLLLVLRRTVSDSLLPA